MLKLHSATKLSSVLLTPPDCVNHLQCYWFADIKMQWGDKKHELNVSTYHMCILLLFNEADKHSYRDILSATGIPSGDLKRALQSLALVKVSFISAMAAMVMSMLACKLFSHLQINICRCKLTAQIGFLCGSLLLPLYAVASAPQTALSSLCIIVYLCVYLYMVYLDGSVQMWLMQQMRQLQHRCCLLLSSAAAVSVRPQDHPCQVCISRVNCAAGAQCIEEGTHGQGHQ